MRRQILMASAGAIAIAGSAAFAAAPPPVYAPPGPLPSAVWGVSAANPPPVYVPRPPIFTWTGIYVGGQIGYAWGNGNFNETVVDPITGTVIRGSLGGTPNGVIGGAHVGANLQFNQWVIGLEGTV